MQSDSNSSVTFRLELFVDDMAASVDFYSRVLGFALGKQHPDGYTPMRNGALYLSLNLRVNLPEDHPVQATGDERLGRGIELVLEVHDIETVYQHVCLANWPLATELQFQPWGLTDFRVIDPDGYYWRITTR